MLIFALRWRRSLWLARFVVLSSIIVVIFPSALGTGQAAGAYGCRGQSVSVARSTNAQPSRHRSRFVYGYDGVAQLAHTEALRPAQGRFSEGVELCGGASEMRSGGRGGTTAQPESIATETAGTGAGDEAREATPATDPDRFKPVRGRSGKVDAETGEIWEKDKLHKDHYEVYKNQKDYDKGRRDRDVWSDGRPKGKK